MNTTGNVAVTGGSGSGASIGPNQLGNVTTAITINSGGDVTLTPGAGGGARIGSPAGAVAGGNISITAGGDIALNGTGAVGTSIRTTGNVTLAGGTGKSIAEGVSGVIQTAILTTTSSAGTTLNGTNQVSTFQATNSGSGSVILNNAVPTLTLAGITQTGGAVSITNAGAVSIGSGALLSASGIGDALTLSGTLFTNNSSGAALSTPNGRWLVYSVNPANDAPGALPYGFKQYAAAPGGGVAGVGDGLLYSVAPVLSPSLAGTVTKQYDGAAQATFSAANLALSGTINGDTAVLGSPAAMTTRTSGRARR